MISVKCDRCDRVITVQDDMAGRRVECPDCGDMNVIPPAPEGRTASVVADGAPASGPAAAAAPSDRATAMGLPPDSGPEQRVMFVRPSFTRLHPIFAALLAALPLAFAITAAGLGWTFVNNPWWVWWLAIPAAGWLVLASLWFKTAMFRALEITNKRTIQREGLLSRETSEALHDHVRNIQIEQSLSGRVLGVGRIRISTSADAGFEVDLAGVPKPHRVRKVIDAYRPL